MAYKRALIHGTIYIAYNASINSINSARSKRAGGCYGKRACSKLALLSWRYRTRIAEKSPNAAIVSERGALRGTEPPAELTGLLRPT